MRNHHEKTRDMARSVLPSNLTVKQWRRQIHHRERHRVRAELHRARFTDPRDLDVSDSAVSAIDGGIGVDGTRPEIRAMVVDRRDVDKMAPLARWAEHHLNHNPALRDASVADCLDYFGSRLPDGLVGFHAVNHIAPTVHRTRR